MRGFFLSESVDRIYNGGYLCIRHCRAHREAQYFAMDFFSRRIRSVRPFAGGSLQMRRGRVVYVRFYAIRNTLRRQSRFGRTS